MRTVTYEINDKKYIRDTLIRREGVSECQIEEAVNGYDGINVLFTLRGENGLCNSYEITNENKEQLFLNQFDDYHQEFFIECLEHWNNRNYKPIGVVRICETNVY